MLRARRRLAALLPLLGIALGCQAPEANNVPFWRGIPARLTTASSLEAENWRRQHGYPGEAQPIPSRVIIGPLVAKGEAVATPQPQAEDADADAEQPKTDVKPEKFDPALPPLNATPTSAKKLAHRDPTSGDTEDSMSSGADDEDDADDASNEPAANNKLAPNGREATEDDEPRDAAPSDESESEESASTDADKKDDAGEKDEKGAAPTTPREPTAAIPQFDERVKPSRPTLAKRPASASAKPASFSRRPAVPTTE